MPPLRQAANRSVRNSPETLSSRSSLRLPPLAFMTAMSPSGYVLKRSWPSSAASGIARAVGLAVGLGSEVGTAAVGGSGLGVFNGTSVESIATVGGTAVSSWAVGVSAGDCAVLVGVGGLGSAAGSTLPQPATRTRSTAHSTAHRHRLAMMSLSFPC